ncbi:notch homolog 2 N-terminal-like protein A [Montipora foliosa]|uniref:notch homolog 2 N-terminal-like protein A n=1 Tax=Montipora foliosa TaxID=591990 RepID=UPI0035F1E335
MNTNLPWLKNKLDSCFSNPCQHNGTCSRNLSNYSCECANGFKGQNCEELDSCFSNPCQNNGTCSRNLSTYSCECANGFKGQNCEELDACLSNPCQNNGTCSRNLSNYSCECANGFKGQNCEGLCLYCSLFSDSCEEISTTDPYTNIDEYDNHNNNEYKFTLAQKQSTENPHL